MIDSSKKRRRKSGKWKRRIVIKNYWATKQVIKRGKREEKINLEIYIQNLDADTQSNLDKFIISVFETSNIQVANIEWIGEIEEYPSVMEILIALKETQPISLENLNSKLRLTDPKWLNRQLDKLIKKSLLVRDNSSKQYALTGKGLGIIPNITNNSNSDIKRALSLAYRKW